MRVMPKSSASDSNGANAHSNVWARAWCTAVGCVVLISIAAFVFLEPFQLSEMIAKSSFESSLSNISQEIPNSADCISRVFSSYDTILQSRHNWPSVDLIVRTFSRDTSLLLMFFKSVDLFWPKNIGDIIVVLDEGEEYLVRPLLPAYVKVYFSKFPSMPKHIYAPAGFIGQQLFHLWCDNYTKSDFVAIADADSPFISKVTPDLLFRERKPIVIGLRRESPYRQSTSWFLGSDAYYEANFMMYLPAVFPVDLFPAIRRHILNAHPEVSYLDQIGAAYWMSPNRTRHIQFSLLGNFMYAHMRDRAYFVFEDDIEHEPLLRAIAHLGWSREVIKSRAKENSATSDKMAPANFRMGMKYINDGICYSFPENTLPNCEHTVGKMHELMWGFEFGDHWGKSWLGEGKDRKELYMKHFGPLHELYYQTPESKCISRLRIS
mmetsp:Transcript_19349/g.31690  ORF Transcript_19349/g.31690 Transcript_19349/m.31690 type:complete len:435 (+) Transcript_19349:264-1568(+)